MRVNTGVYMATPSVSGSRKANWNYLPSDITESVIETAMMMDNKPVKRRRELSTVCKQWRDAANGYDVVFSLLKNGGKVSEVTLRLFRMEKKFLSFHNTVWPSLCHYQYSERPLTFWESISNPLNDIKTEKFLKWLASLSEDERKCITSFDSSTRSDNDFLCESTSLRITELLPNLSSLGIIFKDSQGEIDKLAHLIRKYPKLTALKTVGIHLPMGFYTTILPLAFSLQELTIDAPYYYKIPEKEICNQISFFNTLNSVGKIRSLTISRKNMFGDWLINFLYKHRRLECLNLPETPFSDRECEILATNCLELTELSININGQITDRGFERIIKNCRKLSSLTLTSDCNRVINGRSGLTNIFKILVTDSVTLKRISIIYEGSVESNFGYYPKMQFSKNCLDKLKEKFPTLYTHYQGPSIKEKHYYTHGI